MVLKVFNGTPESPLLNQYYITLGGTLLAHPYLFFTCVFQQNVNTLWEISEFAESGILGIDQPEVALADARRQTKATIRETIEVCDFRTFFEQRGTRYNGMYLPEGRNVLNTEILLRLEDAVDRIRIGEYNAFRRTWNLRYEAYQRWLARFKIDHNKQIDLITPSMLELGVQRI